jgi:hypothetical protein
MISKEKGDKRVFLPASPNAPYFKPSWNLAELTKPRSQKQASERLKKLVVLKANSSKLSSTQD